MWMIKWVFFFSSQFIDDQEFWGGSLGGQLFLQVNPSVDDPILSISLALRYMHMFMPIIVSQLLLTTCIHVFLAEIVKMTRLSIQLLTLATYYLLGI